MPLLSNEHHRHIEPLFARLLEMMPEKRQQFLERHVPDPAIRTEVASLLDHDHLAETEQFLESLDSDLEQYLEDVGQESVRPDTPVPDAGTSQDPEPLAPDSRQNSRPLTLPARYQLIRKLGACGMGTVYLVRDEELDRDVALKIPHFSSDDPILWKRFYREAKSAAKLKHTSICRVFDVGQWENAPYLTMEYIEGKPLSDWIKQSRTASERRLVRLVQTLAEAMQYAHDEGVVHRDLKPSNVMMDHLKSGEWKLVIIDFGLAKRIDDPRLTPSGAVFGTPAYMSPEQAEGNEDADGTACDIYSLGVIFYELLTGQLPFRGSSIEILVNKTREEPTHPSTFRPEVSPQLAAICLKAIARKPAQRFASMGEFAEALGIYLDVSLPITEPLPVSCSKAQRDVYSFVSGKRFLIPAGALFLLVLASFAIWWPQGKENLPNERATNGSDASVASVLPADASPLVLYWQGTVFLERNGEEWEIKLKDGLTVYEGDQYKLVLSTNRTCFLYVIGVDGTGAALWFPHEEIDLSNQVDPNREYEIPDGENWFTFDDRPGTESIYLLASEKPLKELESLLQEPKREARTRKLEALIYTLETKSAEVRHVLETRGQTIQPSKRVAKTTLPNGRQTQQIMEHVLSAGCVVKRIQLDHKLRSE